MTDAVRETGEVEMQILTAQDGTAYLLPRALVEAGRLTPEEATAFREVATGDDVQGLMFAPSLLGGFAFSGAGSGLSVEDAALGMAAARQQVTLQNMEAMAARHRSMKEAMREYYRARLG